MSKKEKNYNYKNKEWLYNQYIELGKTIRKIGKICKVSYTTIRNQLKEFNIKIRSSSEYKIGKKRSEKTKKQISESMKGRNLSEEHKQNMGNSIKKLHQDHPELWEWSEESKKQQSERMKDKYKDKIRSCKRKSPKYQRIHIRIKERKIETGICNICKKPEFYNGLGKLELSNITGKLINDVDNFQWAHRKCHVNWDIENKIVHEGSINKKKKEKKEMKSYRN